MEQCQVLRLFDYVNGFLFWKTPTNPKRTPVGSLAGTISKRGYIHIQIDGKIHKAHRLVWVMFNGSLPDSLDHINGNLTDNRIENLRPASVMENQRNAGIRVDNSSGVKNVSWHTRVKKWGVQLSVNRKIQHFGYYDDLDLAALVAHEARVKFHENFACHGRHLPPQ